MSQQPHVGHSTAPLWHGDRMLHLTPMRPCRAPKAEIEATIVLNPNEVVATQWVDQAACREFITSAGDPHGADTAARAGEWVSPWFAAIERELLHPWWDQMRRGEVVEADTVIHRLDGATEAMGQA